jgi:Na+/H+-dicarboxylate symporter
LIVGLADLKDISKLSKLGGRTVLFYLCSTVVAVTIGLGLANLIKPGRFINKESRESLIQNFSVDASQKIEMAASAKRMVLFNRLLISFHNFFKALSDNGSMLQVILFVILLGIVLILIEEEKAKPVVDFLFE